MHILAQHFVLTYIRWLCFILWAKFVLAIFLPNRAGSRSSPLFYPDTLLRGQSLQSSFQRLSVQSVPSFICLQQDYPGHLAPKGIWKMAKEITTLSKRFKSIWVAWPHRLRFCLNFFLLGAASVAHLVLEFADMQRVPWQMLVQCFENVKWRFESDLPRRRQDLVWFCYVFFLHQTKLPTSRRSLHHCNLFSFEEESETNNLEKENSVLTMSLLSYSWGTLLQSARLNSHY